jgi:hypothetical protein
MSGSQETFYYLSLVTQQLEVSQHWLSIKLMHPAYDDGLQLHFPCFVARQLPCSTGYEYMNIKFARLDHQGVMIAERVSERGVSAGYGRQSRSYL